MVVNVQVLEEKPDMQEPMNPINSCIWDSIGGKIR